MAALARSEGGVLGPMTSKGHEQTPVRAQVGGLVVLTILIGLSLNWTQLTPSSWKQLRQTSLLFRPRDTWRTRKFL